MTVTRGPLSGTMGTYYNVLFLVDNDELAELLAAAPFRISGGSWIPASEWPEGCVDYLDRHARFLAAMRQPELNPLHWSSSLLLRLALSREIYRPIPKENGQIYLELHEPDVALEIAGAVITPRKKLQVNLVSNEGGAVGLRMSYRKKVTYDSEGHAVQHATEDFPNYALYRKLEKWIRERTKSCHFEHAGQVVTTQLRASDRGRESFRNHGWLASKNVRLV